MTKRRRGVRGQTDSAARLERSPRRHDCERALGLRVVVGPRRQREPRSQAVIARPVLELTVFTRSDVSPAAELDRAATATSRPRPAGPPASWTIAASEASAVIRTGPGRARLDSMTVTVRPVDERVEQGRRVVVGVAFVAVVDEPTEVRRLLAIGRPHRERRRRCVELDGDEPVREARRRQARRRSPLLQNTSSGSLRIGHHP